MLAAFGPAGHHLQFRNRLAAGHLVGGENPAGAEPRLWRTFLLAIADPPGFRSSRPRSILRFCFILRLFCDRCLPPLAVNRMPSLPNVQDVAGPSNEIGRATSELQSL